MIKDVVFKERLSSAVQQWERVLTSTGPVQNKRNFIFQWWEYLVKPGIRRIGLQRTKELNVKKRGILNLLLIRQAYLTKRVQQGLKNSLGELLHVHSLIDQWYVKESQKVQMQSKIDEFQFNEKTTLYHL